MWVYRQSASLCSSWKIGNAYPGQMCVSSSVRNGLQAMARELRMPRGVMRDSCCTYLPVRLQVQKPAQAKLRRSDGHLRHPYSAVVLCELDPAYLAQQLGRHRQAGNGIPYMSAIQSSEPDTRTTAAALCHLGDGHWRQHSLTRRRHSLRRKHCCLSDLSATKGNSDHSKRSPKRYRTHIRGGTCALHTRFVHIRKQEMHGPARQLVAWSVLGEDQGSVTRSRNISRLNSRCRQDSNLHRRRGRQRLCGKRQRRSGGCCRWRRR